MFKGSIVALLTPMLNGAVDVARLRELVNFHIHSGTSALVAAGTTGEAGTLSHEEKLLVIKTVIDETKERLPVIAGTAANATQECVTLTHEAMKLGADAALIMTPAYIKPTQEGLYQHYFHIAQAVPIPIILYNVPSRTSCDLLPETVMRLSNIANIIGIKEATGDLARLNSILDKCGDALDVYSGDDLTAAEWMLAGAKGVISVTSNIAPKLMAKMCDLAHKGDKQACLEVNQRLAELHKLLFVESNPIPAKWAAYRMGLMSDEIRLPMTHLSSKYHAVIEEHLHHLSLL
jgi:4-hydroxy-tetrahydrodipicolinate synthase